MFPLERVDKSRALEQRLVQGILTRLSFSMFDYRAKSRTIIFVSSMSFAERELPGTAVQEV